MKSTQFSDKRVMMWVQPRRFFASSWVIGLVFFDLGCGPGTNPGGKKPYENPQVSQGAMVGAYGPFYAAGQAGGAAAPSGCNSLTGRPCMKARASLGMPFNFDTNTSAGAAPLNGSAPTSGPFTASAGAGKTSVSSGVNSPDYPRAENRDLNLIKRQTSSGETTF